MSEKPSAKDAARHEVRGMLEDMALRAVADELHALDVIA
jgi:hypothetical protein